MDLQDIDWPLFGLEDDVRPTLKGLLDNGEPAALATLCAAEGGSPRGVGAQMLIGEHQVVGYLSGGCVESDVALHAETVLGEGRPRRLVYGRGGPADIRLPCGGRIEVLIERIGADDPAAHRLIELMAARTPVLWLSDGETHACLAPGEPPASLPAALQAAFGLAREGGVCGVTTEPFALFRRFDPEPRLIVMGADPPALAIAALGAQLGFPTTFVRPKGPRTPPPIQGARYLRSRPAEALAEAGLDAYTCLAVASHDLELDEQALAPALRSPAAYVGVLGSRRRLPERIARLADLGLSKAEIDRLRAPIGLALAGKSPWEIAVSVVGEIVQILRTREQTEAWPAPVPPLHAVVLTAGRGARYGGAKLLESWQGAPILHGALRAAFAAPVESVVVVTGAHADEVCACAKSFVAGRSDAGRLRLVHAPDHALGLSASLRQGVKSLPPEADGLLLFLGDMPDIPASVLAPIAEALGAGAPAAAPRRNGRRGHPVGISRALFPQLLSLEGDRGAAPVLEALGDRLVFVDTDQPGVQFDIDEPADLERIGV